LLLFGPYLPVRSLTIAGYAGAGKFFALRQYCESKKYNAKRRPPPQPPPAVSAVCFGSCSRRSVAAFWKAAATAMARRGSEKLMLRVFTPTDEMALTEVDEARGMLPEGAVWIDMISPTRAEELFIERVTGIEVPTPEEMIEIETSSRLYTENGALYMTATIVTGIFKDLPESHSVGFVLTPVHLITVRYADVVAFDRFAGHATRTPALCSGSGMALVNIFDAVVDRLADGIEHIGSEVDAISRQAFRRARSRGQQRVSNLVLQSLLTRLGAAQDALSKSRESAVSLSRALGWLSFAAPSDMELGPHLKSLGRDLKSLTDHASYMASNITFLLDATLGLISIEQNAVLKIFSVSAIVFMPPTLVAGIYGMNFDALPELHWQLGYPWALLLMLLSAVLPYLFFRWRGWL
jgi:magnesium transporter